MLHIRYFCTIVAFVQLAALVNCTLFTIKDTYIGDAFFSHFNFSTFDDPTHGRVNYVSREEARKNLAYVSHGKFVMRADHTNMVLPGARGRDSVRIQSYAAYSDSVVVLDLSHMPEGCSTWPAFWTLSAKGPWPQGGEIDIIEGNLYAPIVLNFDAPEQVSQLLGVNKNTRNLASLHTTPNCTVDTPLRLMTGQSTNDNCDTQFNFNQGCGVDFTTPFSYGSELNSEGGGWYVMKRTAQDGVAIWFWPRGDVTVPDAVRYGEPTIQPDLFFPRLPDAYFPFTQSCLPDHFDAHQIIFDDTFCGDFAGALYPTSGCPQTCVDFVDNNPAAFVNAYWEINSLRVYTPYY